MKKTITIEYEITEKNGIVISHAECNDTISSLEAVAVCEMVKYSILSQGKRGEREND